MHRDTAFLKVKKVAEVNLIFLIFNVKLPSHEYVEKRYFLSIEIIVESTISLRRWFAKPASRSKLNL